MHPISASILSDEFAELRKRFPPNIESVPDANIVTITNMSPIEPSIRDFELITLLMHVDVDCYCTIVLNDELHTVKLRQKEEMKYLVDDPLVPDGLIYSARYNDIVRGHNLRPSNRQCINSVAIQSYYSRRNISIKISSDNIQFCGPISEDDCQSILDMACLRLNQVLKDVEYLKNNEEEVRDFMRRCPSKSFKKSEFYPYIREEWLDSVEGEPISETLREIILRVAIGSRSTSVLITRLRSILSYIKKSDLPPRIDNGGLNIVMMKSSYRLPYAFPFIEFYAYLATIPGLRYTVQYNPDVIQKMKIFILRYDNDYQYLDECSQDQVLPYQLSYNDDGTESSMSMMEEAPWSQIETISIASTFFVNQVSFNTNMLRETRSQFLSILEDFILNHVSSYQDLDP